MAIARKKAPKKKQPVDHEAYTAPDLSGIEFVDEAAPVEEDEEEDLPQMTAERMRANQEGAKKALERMKVGIMPAQAVNVPKPIELTREAEAEIVARRKVYEVERATELRVGAAKYRIPAGKIIDSNSYDIESLRRQGVQLREVDPRDIAVRPPI